TLRIAALVCVALTLYNCKTKTKTPPENETWRKGIVTDEFIYEEAPYPSCHAATIAETPDGLVAAWFGGTKERNPDVGIWVSRKTGDSWSTPVEVANGVIN